VASGVWSFCQYEPNDLLVLEEPNVVRDEACTGEYARRPNAECCLLLPVTAVNGQSVAHNTGAVALYYTVDCDRIEIVEEMDPRGAGPLDATIKQTDPPAPGISKAAVETIRRADYLVFRSVSNRAIVDIEWKTQNGAYPNL
jgi:hypothetical protein